MPDTSASSNSTRTVPRWGIAGAAFIVLSGSALHFAFDWSGGWRPVALLAAVNESIWEHLKLAFWPGLLWAAIERARMRPVPNGFWATKGLALVVPPVLIVAIFSTYTALLGRNLFALDIGTFVAAVVAGQLVSTLLLMAGTARGVLAVTGRIALAVQALAFATLTYYPPAFGIFVDSRNGLRGILPP